MRTTGTQTPFTFNFGNGAKGGDGYSMIEWTNVAP
jgi:hypothetical protein